MAPGRYVALVTAVGQVSAADHAAGDRGQLRVALVHDIDALVARGQLLKGAQSLATDANELVPTALGEVVVEPAEMLRARLLCSSGGDCNVIIIRSSFVDNWIRWLAR